MKKYLISGLLAVSLMGCGGDDSSTKSIKQTPNVGKIDNSFVASPHLQKVGEDGEVLNANASSWKAVEIIESGMMFETKTLINSLTKYNYSEAFTYCNNLQLVGFDDWRLPTKSELITIFSIAINSDSEKQYFSDYLKEKPSTWTSVQSMYDAFSVIYRGHYVIKIDSGYVRDSSKNNSNSISAWCVRQ